MPYEIREIISSTVNGGMCIIYSKTRTRAISESLQISSSSASARNQMPNFHMSVTGQRLAGVYITEKASKNDYYLEYIRFSFFPFLQLQTFGAQVEANDRVASI